MNFKSLGNKVKNFKATYRHLPPEPKTDISKDVEEFLASGGIITKLPAHEKKVKHYTCRKQMREWGAERGCDGRGGSGGAGRSRR